MEYLEPIKAFFKWVKMVHSSKSDASAKRVYGGLIIIALLVIVYLVVLKVCPIGVWKNIKSTVEFMFTVGAGLLGLNVLIDIWKVQKGKSTNK